VFFVEVDSSVGVVGMTSGSKGVGEVVGDMAGSRDIVTVVPNRGTVDWDPAEGTSTLYRLLCPGPGPVPYPCPFVPGGGNHVRGSPGAVDGEAVTGTPVGEQWH